MFFFVDVLICLCVYLNLGVSLTDNFVVYLLIRLCVYLNLEYVFDGC